MSDVTAGVAAGGRVKVAKWQITRRQWVWVVGMFIGIGVAFYTYESWNFAPQSWRWPAFYAWNPSTGQLVEPLSGAEPYQTFVLKSWLDEKIPFVPVLAFPYITFLAIAPLVVPFLNLWVSSFRRFMTIALALIVSQLVLDLAYFFFQTYVIRNETAPSGISGFLVNMVWGKDLPFNGFPSGHSAWTTIAICALFRLRSVIPKTSWILMGWLALVYPATVMLRQHYLIDVYAGIFVGFACYWACMFIVERPKLVPRDEPPLGQAVKVRG